MGLLGLSSTGIDTTEHHSRDAVTLDRQNGKKVSTIENVADWYQ